MQFMRESGPRPDAISYNAALNVCGCAGQAGAAQALLQEMRGHGFPPSVVSYGAVLDACAKAADVPRARRVLAGMEAAGVAPNVVAYTSVLDACVRDGSAASLHLVRPEQWRRPPARRRVCSAVLCPQHAWRDCVVCWTSQEPAVGALV